MWQICLSTLFAKIKLSRKISSLQYTYVMWINCFKFHRIANKFVNKDAVRETPSLQCYSVLSDILVKNELCIPLKRWSNVLSTGEDFICISPPSKLKTSVLFCSIYKKTISISAIVFYVIFIQWPMLIMSRDWVISVSYCCHFPRRNC